MAKVFSIHEIVLNPRTDPADFERFLQEEAPGHLEPLGGTTAHLVKGDRGQREGKFALLLEFENVETRDRLFPTPDSMSPDAAQLLQPLWEKWDSYAHVPGGDWTISTDYVVVAE